MSFSRRHLLVAFFPVLLSGFYAKNLVREEAESRPALGLGTLSDGSLSWLLSSQQEFLPPSMGTELALVTRVGRPNQHFLL